MSSNFFDGFQKLTQSNLQVEHSTDLVVQAINTSLRKNSNDFYQLFSGSNNFDTDLDQIIDQINTLLDTTNLVELSLWFDRFPRWYTVLSKLLIHQDIQKHLTQNGLVEHFFTFLTSSKRSRLTLINLLNTFLTYYWELHRNIDWFQHIKQTIQKLLQTVQEESELHTTFFINPQFLEKLNGTIYFASWAIALYPNPEDLKFSLRISESLYNGEFFYEYYFQYCELLYRKVSSDEHTNNIIIELWYNLLNHPSEDCRIMCGVCLTEYFSKVQLHKLRESKFFEFISILDPTKPYLWEGSKILSIERKALFQKAMNLARKLLNQLTFDDFLSITNFDSERRDFWIAYVKQMDSVSFYISKLHAQELKKKGYSFHSQSVKTYDGYTNSGPTLCLEYKDWVIYEFGAIGNALYIYDIHSKEYGNIQKNLKTSEGDFKQTQFQGNKLFRNQGRFTHNHNWQWTIRRILKTSMGLYE